MLTLFTVFIFEICIIQAQLYCEKGSPCKEGLPLPDLKDDLSKGRLPLDLIPLHYNIELQPDIYTGGPPFYFNGYVEIYFNVSTETSAIYLNQLNLNIDQSIVDIRVSPDSPIQPPEDPTWRGYGVDNTLQLFVLYLNGFLVVGVQYVITLGYDATLVEPSVQYGLYWDFYFDAQGDTRYAVGTQFQDSAARWALPCFDEPHFKATYNVTLLHKEPTTTLSNMPLLSQEDREDGWIADTFEETVRMSTYLLCFVVSDFEYVESTTSRGTLVRIWSRPEAVYSTEFANSISGPILEWFEEYTGIEYPLPKIDHIALPTKQGAMENWGLVTYGEEFLLVDPDITVSPLKQRVAEVIAHEIAHMWFGNLVTCLYWNQTWLNEGFANYFQFQPLESVLGWDGYDLQVTARLFSVSDSDSVNTSIPVRMEAETVVESGQSFNTFTYGKGGAILRMIKQVIGNDTFQRGLQRYLNRFAYGNAVTDDLWQALNEQIIEDGITDPEGNPIDIKEKMDPWINQRGHPVLSASRDPGSPDFTISQEMFFNPDGQEANTPSPWEYLWNIPVTYTTNTSQEDGLTTKAWIDREEQIELSIEGSQDWVVFNTEYTGFYRVLQTIEDQIKITDQLLNGYTALSVMTRGQLINDAFQLSRGGYQDEVRAMEYTRYLGQDTSFTPWFAINRNLGYLALMLNKFNDTQGPLQNYMLTIVDPVYIELGWEGDNDVLFTELLRQIVVNLACAFNNEDCIQQSLTLYSQYQDDIYNNPIIPDQRSACYCTAVRYGEQADWDFTYNLYQANADSPWRNASTERPVLLNAMACTSDENQMISYFEATYDPTQIRTRDAQTAVTSIANSELGKPIVWQRLVSDWRNNPLPEGVNKGFIFSNIVGSFNTEEEQLMLEEFISLYPPEGESEESLYSNARDTVERNLIWVERNKESLRLWLEEYGPNTANKKRRNVDYMLYNLNNVGHKLNRYSNWL